jgi:glycosyltransferase involved in cell wall biosynthesis
MVEEVEKMRILVGLIHPEQAGGIYVTEKRFLDELSKQPGIEVSTFLFGSRSPSESRTRRVFRLIADVFRYAQLLMTRKPDIVHINSAYDRRALLRDLWYSTVSRLFRRPLFIKFHGSDARLLRNDSAFWHWLTSVTIGQAHGIAVLSQEEKNNFVRAGFPAGKFVVLTNVVDWQRFAYSDLVPADPPRMLFIARFVPSKGLLDVVRATRIIIDSGRQVELRCVGTGPEMKVARSLVRELGLEKNVIFDGWVPEDGTLLYYLNSTILVLPTETEGFSMTIFQAVAAGLPIVTTKIRAAGQYLKEPANCLWIEPKNPDMLAEKLIQLLDSPELRQSMFHHNRDLARQFPAERVVQEYLQAYRMFLSTPVAERVSGEKPPPRMKVLFNSPDPRLQGGPATHLYLLEGELEQSIRLRPYQYGRKTDTETVVTKFFGRIGDLWSLHLLLNREKPSVIHHNSAYDKKALLRDVPLAWLVKAHRIPLFIKFHGSENELLSRWNPVIRFMQKSLIRSTSSIGVLSPAEKAEYLETFKELDGRVEVVKNIIKPIFHNVTRHESPNPSILFISRFIRMKGMFDLLDAVPRVIERFPLAKFTFIGSGPVADEFRVEIERRGLSASVTWRAQVTNLETAKFYSSAWVFVFPTLFPEGMPMVVAEAMAAGVPIVTTRTRFSLSYMTEGKHCLYSEYSNSSSIAEKIVTLLEDGDLRQRMSHANREFARQFETNVVTREFLEVYDRLARKPEARSAAPAPRQREAVTP